AKECIACTATTRPSERTSALRSSAVSASASTAAGKACVVMPDYPTLAATREKRAMKIGAVMFFTTDSMRPAPLAMELEKRGFESLWVPEHTHIPSSRKTAYPAGGGLI